MALYNAVLHAIVDNANDKYIYSIYILNVDKMRSQVAPIAFSVLSMNIAPSIQSTKDCLFYGGKEN